ncbi:MAG: T9SS type A sorting domain-containing protein [Bacteroidetes bacterium]|nr:T9SS type A sorting domain-containing protein [Bacteroidota bacterium]MBK9671519.1 T9SS type A sorting domain-containing protein [Bacteroidota bacterium]MBP6412175.1 T9SS type A sorting domain-containing protein [Bacteroidia bacterium]
MAQFVTLEGRQFKLNGNDFYPLVCDYSFEIIYNGSNGSIPTLSSLYLSPARSSGAGSNTLGFLPNNNFDFDNATDALNHIDADFQRIKNMGFNAIRTHGITAIMPDNGSNSLYFETIPNYHLTPIQYPSVKIKSIGSGPFNYASQLNLQKLWDFYAIIFTKAQAHDLKILLDVASGPVGSHTYTQNHIVYKNYLSALADHFKSYSSLMAYVIIEEPDFEKNLNIGNSKEDICNYTTLWYDAIKGTQANPNDPNHLITASCVGIGTVFEWDPGVMKLDFFSPHIYPGSEKFEGYTTTEPYQRVLGYIYWLKNNCPMPWITGETGFSACDDSYFSNTLPTWNPFILWAPDDNGTLTDQYWFAVNILNAVRDAGGSGFSWWNYQENWWPVINEEGYGLIDHSGNDKPVVAAFNNYLSNTGQTVSSGSSFVQPLNYFNPYNTGSGTSFNYNTSNENMLSGDAYDANTGQGIKDAFVFAWNWIKTISGPDNLPCTIDDIFYYSGMHTFTDLNGHFELTPYNYSYPYSGKHRIVAMRISATGAERAFDGPWCDNFFTTSTVILDRHTIEYDAIIQNLIINAGFKNFRGKNTLESSNLTILPGATSKITASQQIILNSEFNASYNSEVHIFISESQECPTFSSFAKMAQVKNILTNESSENEIKNIEILFNNISERFELNVTPNPTEGKFLLKLVDLGSVQQQFEVKIFDMYGKKIYESIESNRSIFLDISMHPIGVYTLQVILNGNSLIKKILLN